MINYYEIVIEGKTVFSFFNSIIQSNINIFDCIYEKQKITFKTSYKDYYKIKSIPTTCNIFIKSVNGIKKWKNIFNFYKLFIIMFFLGVFIIFIYSRFVFYVDINTINDELKALIRSELINNKLTVYSLSKKYKTLNKIANSIKYKYSDKIEWIEINHVGVKYEVNIIERIGNDSMPTYQKSHIIASENGFIKDIYAERGEIVRNKGEYVTKGDIIVSGYIMKNDDIKSIVNAKAKVYAETWSKVTITHPKTFYEQVDIKGNTIIGLKIFDKDLVLLKYNSKINKENTKQLLNNNKYTLYIKKVYKENLKLITYNEKELLLKIENMAKLAIKDTLKDKEYIIQQKTLKIDSVNDKMVVEIFFKVYKDIAKSDIIK